MMTQNNNHLHEIGSMLMVVPSPCHSNTPIRVPSSFLEAPVGSSGTLTLRPSLKKELAYLLNP